jgi:hypothetical protein
MRWVRESESSLPGGNLDSFTTVEVDANQNRLQWITYRYWNIRRVLTIEDLHCEAPCIAAYLIGGAEEAANGA